MQIETVVYQDSKWSKPLPALDSKQTLVLVFGAPEYGSQPDVFGEITKTYPNSIVIGCSTSGEIFHETINDHSLSVGVAKFENTQLGFAEARVATDKDSFFAGQDIAGRLLKRGLRAVFVLSEGVHINGSEVVRGLNSILPEAVVVTGGLAGDGDRFEKTWVLRNGNPEQNWIVGVGLYGEHLQIGHGSKGGWDQIGPQHKVTRSVGNVLYQLDGKPALAVYEEYLGEQAKDLPGSGLLFPLAIQASPESTKSIVRTILGIDREKQSLTFAGDIPNGYLAQFMKANFERLVDGAASAAHAMHQVSGNGHSDVPTLMIAISCVGRRLVLKERTAEELKAVLSSAGEKTQQIGFYSYGEISPYTTGYCDLHNQTMTLTSIRES